MEIKTIQLAWYGPYSYDNENEKFTAESNDSNSEIGARKGLYQIYGQHQIYGENALLYIGQTIDSFYSRIKSHENSWLYLIPGKCKIYFGQVLKTKDNSDSQMRQIDDAERLLIDFYKPSQNIMLKANNEQVNNRLILNYGNYGKLERIIGTTYFESEAWQHEDLRELFYKKYVLAKT